MTSQSPAPWLPNLKSALLRQMVYLWVYKPRQALFLNYFITQTEKKWKYLKPKPKLLIQAKFSDTNIELNSLNK